MKTKWELGYRSGVQFDVELYQIEEGIWLESVTAAAFLIMRAIASIDGVTLAPTSGFRTLEKQTQLYNERLNPEVRKRNGPAAKPGYSNHQTGQTIDIATGITYAQFSAGKRSKVYNWLARNAHKFGFYQTVASEPWHWERI